MATAKAVWGIDIGQCALKAHKLSGANGEVQVEAFDIIEHPKILSQPDVDRNQLIRNALEQFLARNSISGAQVAVSVPGQTSFTRFVKLPPVEEKRIPQMIRYEAEQQIPFPIDEVIWRWQTFHDPDSPDVEVGIFAMKRTDIGSMLQHFTGVALQTDLVQMAPLALYNFMTFDDQLAPEGATLLADVGADKTDLVVADKTRLWTRTIQIGGNNFTEALVRSFKLSFSKAEKLKRTAATSKYARQIFQAMRPVFADLVQEIQRSIGFYTAAHRETRFKRLLGLGNGFRLPGLQKYLEQNLNIPVVRIDSYNRLKGSGPANTPIFTENIMSFAVAYGLALQGLGLTTVNTNLLPSEIAHRRRWAMKRPWFGAAAAVLLAAAAGPTWRAYADLNALEPGNAPGGAFFEAKKIETDLSELKKEYGKWVDQGRVEVDQVNRLLAMYGYHNLQPSVVGAIFQAIGEVATDQPRMGGTDAARANALKTTQGKARERRKMITVENLDMTFIPNVMSPTAPHVVPPEARTAHKAGPGYKIVLTGRSPMKRDDTNTELALPLLQKLKDFAKPDSTIAFVEGNVANFAAVADAAGPAVRDPMFPDEKMNDDTRFEISWIVTIENDGIETIKSDGEAAK